MNKEEKIDIIEDIEDLVAELEGAVDPGFTLYYTADKVVKEIRSLLYKLAELEERG